MKARVGNMTISYTSRGIPRYSLDLWHEGLRKHRTIRGDDQAIIKLKAQHQLDEWAERWRALDARDRERAQRDTGKRQQELLKAQAASRTEEAEAELQSLSTLLMATLSVDDRIDWEKLKDTSPFPEAKPASPNLPQKPTLANLPPEPLRTDTRYVPVLGVLDKVLSFRKDRIVAEKKSLFAGDHAAWREKIAKLKQTYTVALREHERTVAEAEKDYHERLSEWTARRKVYYALQAASAVRVDAKRLAYEAMDPEAITEYCDLVLSASIYPDYLVQEFDLDYDVSSKTLVVDYALPKPDDLPRVRSVKYVASRDNFEEQHISDAQVAKMYDDVLYQIVLRTLHELFEADTICALDAVVFNGIVTAIDKTKGKPVTACILSLRANRAEFLEINLAQVDPKACFKSLKGVGSSKLHGLSPVPPIMPLRRDDGRFVSAYEVANTLDESVNLAAMDWEDFEHLIREVFEKEFSSSGGEVRVTQASRDGGVDAVAFDPDPIRGGKIVIQAKRYSNTVGVGAVRDLYGTVLNEGATKGILVTTSDYGPDSYAFAKGKPLVLLSGANLLHILERHGHRARIDLQDAKNRQNKVY